jgi:hypothetical protein
MREVCRTRRGGIAGYSLLQIHALRLQVRVRTRSPRALKEHHNDSSRGCEMNTIVRAIGVLGLAATLGACAVVPAGPGYVGGPGVAVVPPPVVVAPAPVFRPYWGGYGGYGYYGHRHWRRW